MMCDENYMYARRMTLLILDTAERSTTFGVGSRKALCSKYRGAKWIATHQLHIAQAARQRRLPIQTFRVDVACFVKRFETTYLR